MAGRAQFHLFRRYGLDPAKLREAVQSDPAVREEAEAELAAVEGIDQSRSSVAHMYREILKSALE
jgi:hypothetical protein